MEGQSMSMLQETTLIVFGAILGFALSIGTTVITELMKKAGKLKIYTKIVYSKQGNGHSWGFISNTGDSFFQVPLWIEIQNTSKLTRTIRDFNIVLYNKGKKVKEITQITHHDLKKKDDLKKITYGNGGSYSFIAEPLSINKYDCLFLIKKSELGSNVIFDEMKIRYYNEKDKQKEFHLLTVNDCWNTCKRAVDEEWNLLQ